MTHKNDSKWVISDSPSRGDFLVSDKHATCGYGWDKNLNDRDLMLFDDEALAKAWIEKNGPVLQGLFNEGYGYQGSFFAVPFKEEDEAQAVPVETSMTPKVRERVETQFRKVATDGIMLGLGLRVAEIIQDHTIRALRQAHVPETVLNNTVVKAGILMGAPVALNIVLPLVPQVKIPPMARSFIEAAATAAVAKVTNDFSRRAMGYLRPMLREIVEVTKFVGFR